MGGGGEIGRGSKQRAKMPFLTTKTTRARTSVHPPTPIITTIILVPRPNPFRDSLRSSLCPSPRPSLRSSPRSSPRPSLRFTSLIAAHSKESGHGSGEIGRERRAGASDSSVSPTTAYLTTFSVLTPFFTHCSDGDCFCGGKDDECVGNRL